MVLRFAIAVVVLATAPLMPARAPTRPAQAVQAPPATPTPAQDEQRFARDLQACQYTADLRNERETQEYLVWYMREQGYSDAEGVTFVSFCRAYANGRIDADVRNRVDRPQ